MGVRLLAYGDKACFTRPEFKVERVTYEVPTVSAVEGLLKSVYWHPGITWEVDRIHVLNEIRLSSELHNELDGQLRNTTMLRDVAYGIEAHFLVDADKTHPGKVLEMFNHRLEKGKTYRQPCFGLREMQAFLEPVRGDFPPSFYAGVDHDFGWVLYHVDYEHPGAPSSYFRARMIDGVIDVASIRRSGGIVR